MTIGTAWEKQVEFFTDFVDDPNAAQSRLSTASVCIIGCGGAGNIVTQHFSQCWHPEVYSHR
jgi:tRNA A37 threonylcarbamoyladenosine dehydratase